ncbi:hypothetical protein M758_11G103500 [Ceratodon purpureus]|nr:hypothetical protein M758_11G103500 [Ceratodon purpureus]
MNQSGAPCYLSSILTSFGGGVAVHKYSSHSLLCFLDHRLHCAYSNSHLALHHVNLLQFGFHILHVAVMETAILPFQNTVRSRMIP